MKRQYILFFLLLTLLAGSALYFYSSSTEMIPIEELQSMNDILEQGPKVIPSLVRMVETNIPDKVNSPKEWAQTLIMMDLLAEWKAAKAVSPLYKILRTSENLSAMYNSARTLGQIGGKKSFKSLKNVLLDANKSHDMYAVHRKRAAILGLGLCGEPQAIPLLQEELRNQKNADILRVCAAGSLGLLGNRDGLQVALDNVQSSESEITLRALEMLGAINDPSSLSTLQEVLASDAPYMYHLTAKSSILMIEAQQLSEDKRIAFLSQKMIEFHRITTFILWGTTQLKQIGTPQAKEALQTLAETHHPFLREIATMKLQTMN